MVAIKVIGGGAGSRRGSARGAPIVAIWLTIQAVCFIAAGSAHAETFDLPNLVPEPPGDIILGVPDPLEDSDQSPAHQAIRFRTTTFNRGDYPLDLTFAPGSIDDVVNDGRDVFQCVRFTTLEPRLGPICAERVSAGRASYHEIHGHWHFDNYAWYSLVPVAADGLPDFNASPIVPSVKASFCLVDSEQAEDARDTDQPPLTSPYLSCNHQQGITPRHGDSYGNALYGQQIVIDDVAPGVYGLIVTIDPTGRLRESSITDNRAWVVIDLSALDACTHEIPVLRAGVS